MQSQRNEAAREYSRRFPQRIQPSANAFLRLVERTKRTGSLLPQKKGLVGARRRARTPEIEEQMMEAFFQDPTTSIRTVSSLHGVSRNSIQRILKENRQHPYHYRRVQHLHPQDYAARVEFCQWLLRQHAENQNFVKTIMFTDESTFTREGVFNIHNNHFWADQNPHVIRPNSFQYKFSINLWAGILDRIDLNMAPKSIKKCSALRETAITQMNELKKVAEVADRQEVLYESSYPEFKARYKFIERIYGDFYQYHNTIIGTLVNSDEELTQEKEIQAAFDNDYYFVHMVFERVFNSKVERSQSNQSETTNKDHIQLPRLELYKFSGELKTWKTFLDMFNSTIHKNGSLSDVEKFSYLISSLSEEPLSIVSRIPMVGTNYQIAYDALVKRYDNKRLLATHYWNQIENVPSLTENYTSSQLRTLLSTFEENLAALKMLQFPVESWDFVLFNMLLKRLCSSLVSRFELGQDSPTAVPTFKSLSEFLLLMSQASDNVSQNVTPNTSKLTQTFQNCFFSC
ncbi:hypothetical protein TcasGA2_TC005051 [Tribolium castaneum]|uniref:DUF4817 domain-containing protein n=1 Tax=Tribolium castaneum TaxID=7070 RepID=D7EKU0_TRICA|nr:hypothetical protein TcasGA2_TC005051 [Tribolium castaneum]